ncbi:TetR family transcriptional regulator [Streptosporangium violaceochromogenes]|nr:TetR family transcriptional regulator [Streptosporangium violaceochromogenes]
MRLDPRREQAILDATAELLSEVGFDRMSVDQIARRAGASKATIYRRWPGKEALVVDLVRNHLEVEAAPTPGTGSMRDDLVTAVKAFCDVLEERRSTILGLLPALLTTPDLAAALRDNVPRSGVTGVTGVTGVAPPPGPASRRGEPPEGADPGEIRTIAEALAWHRLLLTDQPLDGAFAERAVDRVLLPLIHARAAEP